MTIRIIVADDHPVVRAGLVGMLAGEPDLDVVSEASNGAELVTMAAELNPDLVLTDLRMPDLDGVGATKQLATLPQPPRVLVLTTYDTDADILRAVEAGATGYLLKDTPYDVLIKGIRAAARGETVLAPTVATRLVGSMRTTAERLTPRETEVLDLVADGFPNAAIASKLHISGATVKTHLMRIYHKLNANNRTEAVTEARHRGWLA